MKCEVIIDPACQEKAVLYTRENNRQIEENVRENYLRTEDKTVVSLDREEIEKLGAQIIEDDILFLHNGKIRHDALKTAFLIFSYLMKNSQ